MTVADQVHPLIATALPDDSIHPQQDNASCCTTKTAQEWPEELDKDLKASTWPQNSQDPNLSI